MKFEDVKVDQVLTHEFSKSTYKVIAVHEGTRKIVVEADSNDDIYIVPGFDLTRYSVKPEFFQVGKTYRLNKSASATANLRVLDIYEVENPDDEDDRVAAIALLTRANGKQWITQLSPSQFKFYQEV